MNPLKFEIQIGNKLQQDIDLYKGKLEELLKDRKISIDIDDNVNTMIEKLNQNLQGLTKQQQESLDNLQKAIGFLQQQQKLYSDIKEKQAGAADAKEKASDNIKTYFNNVVKLERALVRLEGEQSKAALIQKRISDAGGVTSGEKGIDAYIAKLESVRAVIEKIRNGDPATLGQKGSMITISQSDQETLLSIFKLGKTAGAEFDALVEKLNRGKMTIKDVLDMVGNGGPIGTDFVRAFSKKADFEQMARNLETLQQVQSKLKDAEDLLRRIQEANQRLGKNIETQGLIDYIEYLRQISRQLHEINQNKVVGTAGFGRTKPSIAGERAQKDASKALTEALKEEEKAQKKAERAKKQSANASEQLAKSENTVAQAIANAAKEAHGQSQVVSDLKSLMLQYFSVYGAQRFLTEMANITGELELQRKSLEVILGSGTAASEMYTQLRDLSQQSPYTFEDLLKAHRQLAAFGIEAKDIYGTMKSLTDIGAGLDVPVERLILAYGHTRSYGYLSGIQNRQFETAGIDLVGALADMYNRRADNNKKLGIASDYVTRADMFKRMRARSIPFSDVEEVIMDLDKPGGKFYNMQIRQYDTLGGKLRNLRNNYQIMMSEMGESNHGLLAGTVDAINELTANWQKYGRVLKGIVVGYAAMKLAALVAGNSVLRANKQIMASAIGNRSKAVATTYLNNPTSSWFRPNMSAYTVPLQTSMGNGEFRNLKTSKEISNITKQRIALTGKLTEAQRAELLVETGVNQARATQISQFSGWKRGLMSIRLGFIQAGAAVKAFTMSLLTNPMTWIFAAVGAITAIKSKIDESSEAAREFAENLKDAAKTDQEGMRQSLSEYDELAKLAKEYSDARNREKSFNQSNPNAPQNARDYLSGNTADAKAKLKAEAEARGIGTVFEDLRKKLETASPFYAGDYFDIMKAQNELDQLGAMFDKFRSLQHVKSVEERRAPDWENRNADSAGEGFIVNAGDYAKARKEFVSEVEKSAPDDVWSRLTKEEQNSIKSYADGVGEAMRDAASRNRAIAGWFAQNGTPSRMKDIFGEMSRAYTRYSDLTSGGTRAHIENLFSGQADDLKASAKALSEGFVSDFKNDFKNDAQGMSQYFTDIMNKELSDAKVSDPQTMGEITDMVLESFYNQLGSKVSAIDKKNFFANQAQGIIGAMIQNDLQGVIDGSMTDEQIDAAVKKVVSEAIKKFQEQHKILIKILKRLGVDIDKALNDAANNVAKKMLPSESWQKRALKWHMHIEPEIDNDWSIYIDKIRKEISDKAKSMSDYVERFKAKFKLDISVDVNSKDAADRFRKIANSFKDSIIPKLGQRLIAAQLAGNKKLVNDLQGQIDDYQAVVDGYSELADKIDYLNKSEGVGVQTQKEQDKANRAAEQAKNKKEAADRKADQTAIKNLEARYNAIRKVYEWYKRWYDLLGNSDAAMDAAKNLVDASDIKGIDLNDLKSWDTYVKLSERERDAVGKTKLRLPKENADRIKQIQANYTDTINRGDADEFSRNQDRAASALERQLEVLGKQYDLYKKIYELTGDRDLAARLSGRSAANASQSKADDYRQAIQAGLDEARRSLSLGAFSLDFDKLFGMDDEKIREKVGTILNIDDDGKVLQNNKKLALQYKAIVEALREWRDLQEQINNESKETYASTVGKMQDYNSVAARIDAEAKDAKDKIDKATDKDGKPLSDEEKQHAKDIINQNAATKKLQATLGYINLINNAVSMGDADFVRQLTRAYDDLNGRLAAGTVSASDYAKEMEKLDKISLDYRKNGLFGRDTDLAAFMQGGLPGLQQRWQGRLNARRGVLAEDLKRQNPELAEPGNEEALKKLVEERVGSDAESQRLEKKLDSLGLTMDALSDLSSVAGAVTGAFDGLQQAAQSLSTMFDALGNESMANFFSDFSDVVGGIGSIFSPVSNVVQNAMNGNVGGLVSSAISAPFQMIASPVTAFAQLHDKRNQRAIDKLQESVSRIEGYEKVIATAQKRTLGYDDGSYIRQMQEYYAGNDYAAQRQALISVFGKTGTYTYTETGNKEGAAGKAMAKYYAAAGGGDISGYEQQYNLLVQERQDYIDMYNAEDGKKEKSKASLQEYKEKIAELDDQIRYFAEDLANTLYGIDLKSWADQLGDALMTAFENGEDAAEAFDDSVTSILQGLVKNMIVTSVIEPKLNQLRTKLFGTNGTNGSFDAAHPDSNRAGWMADINEALGDNGYVRESVEGAKVLFDSMESLANGYGNTLMNSDSASMSSSVKGITEQTGDLLASYLNAIRADVSVVRQLYGSKAVAFMDAMSVMARSQVQYQSQIAANTLRNAQAAESIVQTQNNIIYILNAVVNDSKQFNVRAK